MKLSQALTLALDTETTGPEPTKDDIVELGGAYLRGGERLGPLQRTLVDPGRYIPAGAWKVHGIRTEDLAGAPRWPEAAARLKAHLDQRRPVVVGYNALDFDRIIIDAQNARHGLAWRLPEPLDPFVFALWHLRGLPSLKLAAVAEHFGLHLPEDQAHHADMDALVAGLLLHAMVQAGLIPDDVDGAFQAQRTWLARLSEERALYGRTFYRDRQDGRLRLGRGKHCGRLLEEADPEYLRWLLGRPDLTEEAQFLVRRALGQDHQAGLSL